MIVMLNASTNLLRQGCKQLTPHSEFGTCRRTAKMIDLRIGDIVIDDSFGDTISVDDMMSNEVNHVGGFNSTSKTTSAHFEK